LADSELSDHGAGNGPPSMALEMCHSGYYGRGR
jgi:hypothetical protein